MTFPIELQVQAHDLFHSICGLVEDENIDNNEIVEVLECFMPHFAAVALVEGYKWFDFVIMEDAGH